jgi:hypothetical protein
MWQNMLRKFNLSKIKQRYPKPLIGDWGVILASFTLIIFAFQKFWVFEHASLLKIRQGNQIIGTFDLNQSRELQIKGPIGVSYISIQQGKVRFKQSPCHNQYCVHQGWLNHAEQVAICLPNQISLQLMGSKNSYDSLNY